MLTKKTNEMHTYPIAIDNFCPISIAKKKEDFVVKMEKCNVIVNF